MLFIGIFLNVSVGIVIFEGGNFVFNIWIIVKLNVLWFFFVVCLECILYNVLGKKWVELYIECLYIMFYDVRKWYFSVLWCYNKISVSYVFLEFGIFIIVSENVRKIIV